MANNNFVVQNGITIGNTTIFAGNGDIITAGNVTTQGSGAINSANGFGGLNPASIYSGASNVSVTASTIYANIASTPVATVTGSLVTIAQPTTVLGTVTATTFSGTNVNAVTIGNSGAVLYGTLNSSSASQPNITAVGTLTGLTVSGAIVPNGNVTVNLGSTSAWWNNIYGTAVHSLYADLAENYQADKFYNPGTVLMFGGANEVTVADADTTAVAGVVSTNPAHLMNGALNGQFVTPLALMGRVPCNVIGPIVKGDLLVSAGFGFAKTNNSAGVGQVIGKALADFPILAKGVIEVVVGRV
jgi:hypothetical protein